MKKLLIKTLAVSLMFCTANSVFAIGIPVADVDGLVQAIATVNQLKQQVESLKKQYDAITGTRNLGDILNNPALREYLPSDWANIYDKVQSGQYKGLSGAATAIKDAEKLYGTSTGQQRVYDTLASNKAMTQTAYQNTIDRLNNIQSLMKQINSANDTKAAADLQNRIASENAMIQNEQTRLNLMVQLQQAEMKLAEQQQAREFKAKYFK
ncbi:MAG: P-type DNA transfer protein VirB5 [Pseudomonadota bacterium]